MLTDRQKLLRVIPAVWAAHLGFWHWIVEAVFGWGKTTQDQQDRDRFKGAWGWYGNPDTTMLVAWDDYTGDFHTTKNLMSEWVRSYSQLAAKFFCWLVVNLIFLLFAGAITLACLLIWR